MSRPQRLNAICINIAVIVLAVLPLPALSKTLQVLPQNPTGRSLGSNGSFPSELLPFFQPQIEDLGKTQSQIAGFSCLPEPIESSPRSTKIITRSQIQQQAALTQNVNGILRELVPGLSPITPSGRRGLTLRGRRVGILIDGVPLAPGSAGFTVIYPNNIERIEVIPTPSPLCRA